MPLTTKKIRWVVPGERISVASTIHIPRRPEIKFLMLEQYHGAQGKHNRARDKPD